MFQIPPKIVKAFAETSVEHPATRVEGNINSWSGAAESSPLLEDPFLASPVTLFIRVELEVGHPGVDSFTYLFIQ